MKKRELSCVHTSSLIKVLATSPYWLPTSTAYPPPARAKKKVSFNIFLLRAEVAALHQDGIGALLILRTGLLKVNFDPALVRLLREVTWRTWIDLDFAGLDFLGALLPHLRHGGGIDVELTKSVPAEAEAQISGAT